MARADHIPEAVRLRAEGALATARGLDRDRVWNRVRAAVPPRYDIEIIWSVDNQPRLSWPEPSETGPLFPSRPGRRR